MIRQDLRTNKKEKLHDMIGSHVPKGIKEVMGQLKETSFILNRRNLKDILWINEYKNFLSTHIETESKWFCNTLNNW